MSDYALCNDGTRIYLELAGPDYSAKCENHGGVGLAKQRDAIDRAMNDHAVSLHQGMHSHACQRS
jgi:hypothetical protein